jgi:hypothetical protein
VFGRHVDCLLVCLLLFASGGVGEVVRDSDSVMFRLDFRFGRV